MDDPVEVDPGHYQVEHEDDQVRVLRIKYGPGDKSVMHGHPASIAISLTGAHVRFGFPDGSTEELTMEVGEVMAIPEGEHLPENLTDNPMEAVLVELKG